MSNILGTISVLQPISDVTAITCGVRHAQRSQAGPNRRENVAVQAVRFGGLTAKPNIAVARRPCLWDISNKIYINQDAEKAASRKITEKMYIDIDYVSFFSDSSAALTATTPAATGYFGHFLCSVISQGKVVTLDR